MFNKLNICFAQHLAVVLSSYYFLAFLCTAVCRQISYFSFFLLSLKTPLISPCWASTDIQNSVPVTLQLCSAQLFSMFHKTRTRLGNKKQQWKQAAWKFKTFQRCILLRDLKVHYGLPSQAEKQLIAEDSCIVPFFLYCTFGSVLAIYCFILITSR